MLLYNIYDYDDFKYLFGLEHHGNGVKSRKNKILLAHLKTKSLIQYCREHDDFSLLQIRNMADLKKLTLEAIQESGRDDNTLNHEVKLIGKTYYSAVYATDSAEGLCEDFDKKSVRYINKKSDHPYKMRAGKFITAIIKETELGRALSDTVINWLAEEFTADWSTYTMGKTPEVTLHVDDNFEKIYSEHFCKDFRGCSCMVGRDRHSFYENAVDAKAAYITDKEGFILARAIVFTDVKDETGKKWRLCERQYSRESNEIWKRALVDLLIKGGHISGYKQIGAGCSESRAFVDNEGNSLHTKRFTIKCSLGCDDILSYQDSFKYYDYDNEIAGNWRDFPHEYELDTTDFSLNSEDDPDAEDGPSEWDDYHQYNAWETRLCYYHGEEVYVDEENLEDFVCLENGSYHHRDDVVRCEACNKWILKDDALHNDTIEGYFCDEECRKNYIREHWHFSDYDEEFYPNEDDITAVSVWDEINQNYKPMTISTESMASLISEKKAFGFGEAWFITNAA